MSVAPITPPTPVAALAPSATASATRITLIRHGETAWNAERRLQGHLDIALNARGLAQAAALGQALAATAFDAIVASDLQRAWQTAAAIAATRDVPVQVQRDAGLRERCYGRFEGLLYADIEAAYPAEYAAWQGRDIDAVMPPAVDGRAAESFRQFYGRSVGAMLAWAARYPGGNLAMVAHGGVLECAYRAARGLALDTPRDFAVLNASINVFDVEDGVLSLHAWGEVAHLRSATLDELP